LVMIVSEQAAHLTVQLDSFEPIHIASARRRWWRIAFAQVRDDIAVITARVKRRDHASAIRTFPNANVERDADRRVFRRAGAADGGCRVPCQFLRGKTLDSGMSHEAGQRRGETEAVRQHVFGTGLAELALEKLVAVKELPDN